MTRLNSPLKWFGGKNRMDLKNWILPILESIPHETYVEVFGGSGGLLISKTPVYSEVYNDLDDILYDFFVILSKEDLFNIFYQKVSMLPCSKKLFRDCFQTWRLEEDKIERVVKWFVVVRNAFAVNGGWSCSVKSVSAWLHTIKQLPEVHARLQKVLLENSDWRKILDKYDSLETLFYLDPPYVHSTRSAGDYNFEMSDEDHIELVEKILSLKGNVVLSGFENDIYKPLENNGWVVRKKKVSCFASPLKGIREEILWIKPFKSKVGFFF